MLTNERQNRILEFLKQNKTAVVKELAKDFYVSEATIRRDLKEMQTMGLIERSHGGAVLPENAEEVSIFVRIGKNAKEKERAATNALKILSDLNFKNVFIDSSSTALALAERMELSYKTVVTNSLQTALQLSKKPNVTLILLGGNVQFNTNSATGSWTARQLNDFTFDLMLSSCAAVIGADVFESSLDQKEIKRAAFVRSSKRLLVVDHSKFSAHGAYRLTPLSSFDFVATDVPPPERLADEKIRFVY